VNKTNHSEAALKQIPIDEVSDISDHMVEIEILMECRHLNVIGLLETFYQDNKLSVRISFLCVLSCIFFSTSLSDNMIISFTSVRICLCKPQRFFVVYYLCNLCSLFLCFLPIVLFLFQLLLFYLSCNRLFSF